MDWLKANWRSVEWRVYVILALLIAAQVAWQLRDHHKYQRYIINAPSDAISDACGEKISDPCYVRIRP